jgi:putative membrane protein
MRMTARSGAGAASPEHFMAILSTVLIALVAAEHLYFLVLEMFLWQTPTGLKTFRQTPEKAAVTAALAANQGLYNGFLAAALIAGFFIADANAGFTLQVYGLICVVAAGLYGGASVSPRIWFVQALPGALALAALLYRG